VFGLALLLASLFFVGPAQAQATAVPLPTPRADGAVVHIVQEGETLWVIAITYAPALEMTAEEALPYITELNNNPAFLNPGDEVLLRAANSTATTPEGTAAATGEATPAEGTAAATPDAAGTPAAEEAAPEATPAAEATPAVTLAGTICVGAFNDANADGQRNEGEGLVADAAIQIARDGAVVSTYITDGASEPFCVELTEPGSYQLTIYPPAGFVATTEDNWAVSIANGESYTVSFGLGEAPAAVADTAATTAADPAAATPGATEEAAGDDGLPGNLGLIVIGVAAMLVVLAVVGVVLLRRG
jgi:hypothetical protein